MKNIKILSTFLIAGAIMFLTSCQDTEIMNFEGERIVVFAEESGSLNVLSTVVSDTFAIPVNVTKLDAADRTYTFSIDESSTAIEGKHFEFLNPGYSFTVPANSFLGELNVLSYFDSLPAPPAQQTLVINIDSTAEFAGYKQTYNLTVRASCPSDLAGVYDAVSNGSSTDPGAENNPLVNYAKTVTISAGSVPGSYSVDAITADSYFAWYEVPYGHPGSIAGSLSELCGEITISANGTYGTPIVGSGSLDETNGVITYSWSNGFADESTIVLTPR